MMLEMQIDLDQEKNTPSDYALLVRNIPLTMTQEELKINFETMFNKFNVKVQEVNYCYEIDEMVSLNKIVAKMNFLLAICKIHDQKEKKRIGCSIEELETHKDYKVPTKRHKFRFWRFRLLDKKKI